MRRDNNNNKKSNMDSSFKKLGIILLILLVGSCLFLVDVQNARLQMVGFINWIHSFGIIAPIIYAASHSIAVTVCFPGTMLFEIGAGFLFGIIGGSCLVSSAKIIGASLGFLLGRTLLHDWVKEKLRDNQTFKNIYENVGKDQIEGFKFAILLRLSPVPSWINNYGLSLTSIQYIPFIVATAFGSLPMIIQNVYIGSMLQGATFVEGDSSGNSTLRNVLFGVGLIATIGVTRMIFKYATQKAQNKIGTQ